VAVYVEALLAATESEYATPILRSVLNTLSVHTQRGCFLFIVKVFERVVPPAPVASTLKVNACDTPAVGTPERTPDEDRSTPPGRVPLPREYPVENVSLADKVLLYADPTLAISFTDVVFQDGGESVVSLTMTDL